MRGAESSSAVAKQAKPDLPWQRQLENWQYVVTDEQRINGYMRPGLPGQPTLHFLHGNGFCAMTLAAMASQLPRDWQLCLTDVPGHGLSDQPNRATPHWPGMALDIAQACANKLQAANTPVVGVGHSMGGILTLLAAAQRPELFKQIILLDPPMMPPKWVTGLSLLHYSGMWRHLGIVKKARTRTRLWANHQAMYKAMRSKGLYANWHSQALWDFVHFASKRTDDGSLTLACSPAWEAAIFGTPPQQFWHSVKRLQVPCSIVCAEDSYSFVKPAAQRAARLNSQIQVVEYGQGHCFMLEQPGEAAMFLQQLIAA